MAHLPPIRCFTIWLYPSQCAIQTALLLQLLYMADTHVSGAFKIFQCQADSLVSVVQLLRTTAGIPLRLNDGII